MTTINNLTIEQMREIVRGAPEHTQVCIPCLEDVMYFAKRDDGKWFKWSNGYNQWLEYFGKVDPMDLALDLNNLRTAIAKHDTTDHVTDIRNHVSPSTIVKDLGCNHNFEDVTIYGDSHKTYQCTICEFRDGEAERHG